MWAASGLMACLCVCALAPWQALQAQTASEPQQFGPRPAPAGSRAAGPPPSAPGVRRSMTRTTPDGYTPSADPHDIEGVYTWNNTFDKLPYQLKPELVARRPEPRVDDFSTPNLDQRKCHPTTYIAGGSVYPMQIIQTPDQIIMVWEEDRRTRRIYLDGKMPRNPTPTYNGYSVGHWEGDTLLVETRGFKGRLNYFLTGNPDIYVTEKFRKVEGGKVLQIDVEYHNDKEWSQPGTMQVLYNWRPDAHLLEYVCEEYSDAFGVGYDSLR
ncbi:MAG: hypothetical protein QM718_06435 [Steroidobacteraceae bacterium]